MSTVVVFVLLHWSIYVLASLSILRLFLLSGITLSSSFLLNKLRPHPAAAAIALVALASMAGVPPFFGF